MIIILIYSVEEILNSFPDMKKIEFNDKEFIIVKEIVSIQIFDSIKKNKISK